MSFGFSKSISGQYERSLRKVSNRIAKIIDRHLNDDGFVDDDRLLMEVISEYELLIEPWAKKIALSFINKISRRNKRAWTILSKALSRGVRSAMTESSAGLVATQLQNDQVELIKSLPRKAAERAQSISREAMITGERNEELARRIKRTEKVTNARAMLIARTETAKANSSFTIARAQSVGITHYVWRTMKDGAVRDSHKAMEGTVHEFTSAPTLPDGNTHHPGNFPNCRCYPEPVVT